MADENTTPAVNDVKIDESSIAHPDPDRRGSLEKQLLQRPGKAELIESKQKPSSLPVLTFYPLLLLTCLPLFPLSREHPPGFVSCSRPASTAKGGESDRDTLLAVRIPVVTTTANETSSSLRIHSFRNICEPTL